MEGCRVDQKPAQGRGGKEHAATRQKPWLNSDAWLDYTPVSDLKPCEIVLFTVDTGDGLGSIPTLLN
jgi:hypothetical protein